MIRRLRNYVRIVVHRTVCPPCQGTGSVEGAPGWHFRGAPLIDPRVCRWCDGTGWVRWNPFRGRWRPA